jgi:hypothetical protein
MTTSDPLRQPGAEVPGDTGAPDIVGPTGEEMPVQTHDDVDRPVPQPGTPSRPAHTAVTEPPADRPFPGRAPRRPTRDTPYSE